MAKTLLVFPDAHGIARGKLVNEAFRPDLRIGCASGVFSKDVFGTPQLFDVLATPSGAADITIRPEDGEACSLAAPSDLLFGATSIAIGDVADPSGAPHPLDFRRMLREALAGSPEPERFLIGAELEFHILPADEGVVRRPDGQAYAFSSASMLSACLREMMETLDRIGARWLGFSQENHLNQFEFSLAHSAPLVQADRIFLARLALRDVAARHGLRCTFAPMVREDGSPSNLHIHVSDAVRPGRPTAMAAGLARALHGAFLAFCPTRNGRRLQAVQSFSSKLIDCGDGHRFRAIRIIDDGADSRLELRTPTSDANPYLATLMLLAGLWSTRGLNDDDPPPLGGPAWGSELPWDFDESLARFRADALVRRMLSEETIALYTRMKELEARSFDALPFDEEAAKLSAVL